MTITIILNIDNIIIAYDYNNTQCEIFKITMILKVINYWGKNGYCLLAIDILLDVLTDDK